MEHGMITADEIAEYFSKSGDDKLLGGTVLQIDSIKGFMIYRIADDSIVINHAYGDGKAWDKIAVKMAQKLGLKKVRFGTRRNPKTFERKFGYKVIGYAMEKEV